MLEASRAVLSLLQRASETGQHSWSLQLVQRMLIVMH